ncbi:helix-turn-helix transcriptional regulator [Shewanella sp. Shew256]|uniref:helix-turn-helix transcriptional regulator n=1 Tax=Shewanella sp. Shew256 TaxID=1969376 RepID=UPI000B49D13C|nr:helix-turn-helix domain-containing protein [Shewanella sp. Shew256]
MISKPDTLLAMYLDDNRLITKREIQRALGISRSTLCRWIYSGKFPAPKIKKHGWQRWLFKDVHQWLNEQNSKAG